MNETELLPPEAPAPPVPAPNQALVRQTTGAVAEALSVEQVTQQLEYIRAVMARNMTEGTDYGRVPGCGDKPGLFQPGAQKLGLTFQLTPSVKQETLKEYPPYHREYSFIVTVTSKTGRQWDGVGTCSTLESKYRYRKAERKCPVCGKHAIIQGKEEYGGGWVCFKKKGGCGAKFAYDDQKIQGQAAGQVESENPADYWNTVRKMAFKRGFVHAIINATNTSELWSQDLEDLPGVVGDEPPPPPPPPLRAAGPTASREPGPSQHTTQPGKAPPAPRTAAKPAVEATPDQKARFLELLKPHAAAALEYCRDQAWLLPNETLPELPIVHVPTTKSHADKILAAVQQWEREHPANAPSAGGTDLWWRNIIVPIPRAGEKRDQYLANPDTVGSLYDCRHDEDETARKRLFGFIEHFEVTTNWVGSNGEVHQRSQTEIDIQEKFRKALDACREYMHDQESPTP